MPDRTERVAVRTAVISGAAAARRLEWDISKRCPSGVTAALAGARIDVVVNNAAVGSSQNWLPEVDPDALTAALDNNVAGAVQRSVRPFGQKPPFPGTGFPQGPALAAGQIS